MNNAKVIEGINATIEGLTLIRDALQGNETVSEAPAKTTATAPKALGGKKAPAKATKTPAPAKTEEEPATATEGQTYTTAELSGMKYNEFKKLASSLGVDCKGTRDEIMARVVALGVVTDADSTPAEAPVEKKAPAAKTPAKSGKSASVGKGSIKKADAPATDEFDEQAEEIAKDTPAEDIIASLKEVGVKATKLNYKKQLAHALRENLLSVGDDEEEVSADTYFAEYDAYEVNDPSVMGEARATACAEKQGAILEAVSSQELTSDDIIDFLQNNATQEELDLLGDDYEDDDLVKLYIEVAKHFIDEDGDEHEPGEAYMIGKDAYCCGMPLAYDEKTNKFLCSHCAGEYDAE